MLLFALLPSSFGKDNEKIFHPAFRAVCPAIPPVRRKRGGKALQVNKKSLPLHRVNQEFISNSLTQLVISFSVINYVVSMRCPTGVAQLIFFIPYPSNLLPH